MYAIVVIQIVAIWQFIHFLTGYPILDFHTRSYVHSVESDVLFNFRLTSLLDEPSFLVPILMDGLILGFILYASKKKYIWQVLLPGLFVLVFFHSR